MASNYVSIAIIIVGFIFLAAMILSDGVNVVKRWDFYVWIFTIPMNVYMLAVGTGFIKP